MSSIIASHPPTRPSSHPFFPRAEGCVLPLWGCRAPMTSIIASHPPLPVPSLSFFPSRGRRAPSLEMRGSDDQHLASHLLLPGCLRIFIREEGNLPLRKGGFHRPDDFRPQSPSYPGITLTRMKRDRAQPDSPFPHGAPPREPTRMPPVIMQEEAAPA